MRKKFQIVSDQENNKHYFLPTTQAAKWKHIDAHFNDIVSNDKNIVVAVGNSIYVNKDGQNWINVGLPIGISTFSEVAWFDNKFVAISGSKVYISNNGENWIECNTDDSHTFARLKIVNGKLFRYYGTNDYISVSDNGFIWKDMKVTFEVSSIVRDLTWGNNTYVCVGNVVSASSKYYYNCSKSVDDMVTWTNISSTVKLYDSSTNGNVNYNIRIEFFEGIFFFSHMYKSSSYYYNYIVYNNVLTSAFKRLSITTPYNSSAVECRNSFFKNKTNTIMYWLAPGPSYNSGTTVYNYTYKITVSSPTAAPTATKFNYNNTSYNGYPHQSYIYIDPEEGHTPYYVCGANHAIYTYNESTSKWTRHATLHTAAHHNAIRMAYQPDFNKVYKVDSTGTITESDKTLKEWVKTKPAHSAKVSAHCEAYPNILYDNGKFIIGDATSDNGEVFELHHNITTDVATTTIVKINDIYYKINSNKIYSSEDSIEWTEACILPGTAYHMVYAKGKYVVVGANNKIFIAENLTDEWRIVTLDTTLALQLYHIEYKFNKFIIFAKGANPKTYVYSGPDGDHYNQVLVTDSAVRLLYAKGQIYVFTNNAKTYTSIDGVNFNTKDCTIDGVSKAFEIHDCVYDGMFMACGTDEIFTSYNGYTWRRYALPHGTYYIIGSMHTDKDIFNNLIILGSLSNIIHIVRESKDDLENPHPHPSEPDNSEDEGDDINDPEDDEHPEPPSGEDQEEGGA